MSTAAGLVDWLVEISGSKIVIDLSELTFMDSSGMPFSFKRRMKSVTPLS